MMDSGMLIKKRAFDIVAALAGLVLLLPLFLLVGILIKVDSPGPVFYRQVRIGKDGREFNILKFRKMRQEVGDQGLNITVANDDRMTSIGKVLREYKLDELPQLWNVLLGDMSIVGPRPETPNYVALYTEEQRQVLTVRPGITDYASLEYIDEGALLQEAEDPDRFYTETLIPLKIEKNLKYIEEMSMRTDLKLIFRTLGELAGKAVRLE